jgi:uncharacterized membrane protein
MTSGHIASRHFVRRGLDPNGSRGTIMTYAVTVSDLNTLPMVRKIRPADLVDALARGLDDFWAMPTTNVIFLSLLYPVVGLLIARMIFGYELMPLLFPLAAGFALLGPFAAIWLYELSRRREQGLDVSWQHAFDVLRSPSLPAIVALGLLLMTIFVIWIATAHAIYVAYFGYAPPQSVAAFLRDIFTSPAGWALIVIGNGVGFLFAALVLTISVVSFPLLLDRKVSAGVAILTSVRAVLRNPASMALWGLIVAAGLVIGSLPLFFGLAVVMPVLGHATWHLYRKAVVADRIPHPDLRSQHKPQRYAADFPAALFG